MGINPHDQIIKQLCKDTLLPLGVFQKGTSRIYIDDNGYFFTVLEFQPSAYTKGTYLNVALHFLWNERDYFSFDFPFGADIRVKNFVFLCGFYAYFGVKGRFFTYQPLSLT